MKGNALCRRLFITLAALLLVLAAAPARAEIVFFNTGRTLSIKDHRAEDDKLVLMLRGGGEVVCEVSVIDRIVPDEVPYPEPESPQPVIVAQQRRHPRRSSTGKSSIRSWPSRTCRRNWSG